MMLHEILGLLFNKQGLTRGQMREALSPILAGEASPALIGAFLAALRVKGETSEEIIGAVELLREKATRIKLQSQNVVDTCGTGGDASGTFNISTASALVAAAAGAVVAKHGNQAISSACGSANVLAQLGLDLERTPDQVAACIDATGLGFLFAPKYHSALRHVGPIRQELKQRTLFNLLGPLLNPAGARRQVMGVYAAQWLLPVAQTLLELGSERVMVVHAQDGLDEISLCAPTLIAEVNQGQISEYTLNPQDWGFTFCSPADLKGGDAPYNAQLILEILKGTPGPKRDVVVLNAAAALLVAGKANNFKDALVLAGRALDEGQALKKLNELVNFKG